jgi:Flp pilus assembly protein TadD
MVVSYEYMSEKPIEHQWDGTLSGLAAAKQQPEAVIREAQFVAQEIEKSVHITRDAQARLAVLAQWVDAHPEAEGTPQAVAKLNAMSLYQHAIDHLQRVQNELLDHTPGQVYELDQEHVTQ